jgi:hypothetical protein
MRSVILALLTLALLPTALRGRGRDILIRGYI